MKYGDLNQAQKDARNAKVKERYWANIEQSRERNKLKRRKQVIAAMQPTRPMPFECELCGKTPAGRRGLMLDHCHVDGKFRGWLCVKCNVALGTLGDTPDSLQRALDYVRRQ
jgi:hypothetical protein